jgi:hypothetical protein
MMAVWGLVSGSACGVGADESVDANGQVRVTRVDALTGEATVVTAPATQAPAVTTASPVVGGVDPGSVGLPQDPIPLDQVKPPPPNEAQAAVELLLLQLGQATKH